MERNEALETYQKETYNQDIATYTFSVEVAGVTSPERTELKAKKPGINLHFLRYGVFNAKPNYQLKKDIIVHPPETESDLNEDEAAVQEKVKRIELDEVEVTAEKKTPETPNDKLPDIKNAYYARTILNEGYLYVIEEGDDKYWLEYEINEYGTLRPVLWKDNLDENNNYKDLRDKSGNTTEDSLIFKQCTILWVGYSATQLSLKQLEDLKGNLENTNTFLKVECEGFDKSEAENLDYKQQIAPYNRFYTLFKSDQDTQSMIFKNRLTQITEIEEAPDPNNENVLLEDMFVTLLDPIGCADDLYYLTEKEHNYHEALIATLTIPQTPRNYYESTWGKEKESIEDISKEIKEQVNYLFVTALSTYKFVYDNPETIDKYSRDKESWSHGVDQKKVYKILNVEERQQQRQRIYKMRDALGTFIKSENYQTALLGYKNNSPFRQEAGKLHAANHLYMLAVYEGIADRDLNLTKDYKPNQDYWLQQIRGTLVSNPTIFKTTTALLDLEIDIAFLENEPQKPVKTHLKFGKKFVSLGKKILEAYAGIGSLSQSEFELVNKKIFYVSAISKAGKNGPFYKLKNKTFSDFLSDHELRKLAKQQHNHQTKTYTYFKVHPDALDEAKKIARGSGVGKNPVIYVDKADSTKYGEKVQEFLDSKAFNRFLLIYELWGLAMAGQKMAKDGVNFNTVFSFSGAFVKTSAIVLKLTKETKAAELFDDFSRARNYEVPRLINRHKGRTIAITSKSLAKGASAVGGAFTVVACAKDSYIAFAKADYDAAMAQTVAGVASGVLLASQVGLIAELAFPPALIISLIGMAAFGIAIYFTDTELEAYFKHYPLSTFSNIKSDLYTLEPYDFMLKLYEHRDELLWPNKDNLLVTESYDHLKDFKRVFVNLMNVIGNGSLEIRGSEHLLSPRDKQSYFHTPLQPYKDKWYHPWRSIGIQISFGAFLRSVEDLEYELYYVNQGSFALRESRYAIPISKKHCKVLPFLDKNNTYTVELWLQIPDKLTIIEEDASQSVIEVHRNTKRQTVNLDLETGEIAVLCKLNSEHQQNLPLTQNDTEGYLYSQLPIQYRDKNTGVVSRRSGFTQVVTKTQFLKTYPLKKIKYAY